MKNLRIVFMGTPEFAVATLRSLIDNNLDVVAVITTPDKPSGRGRKIAASAVKIFAESRNLPVFQPANLKDPGFVEALRKLHADIFIVVAFRMLPEAVWRLPAKGTINLHASLLPQYRGAAPINHAIINGESITGATTFIIDEKIDTGSILLREETPIFPDENAGDLHDRLMELGAGLVIRTIEGIAGNRLERHQQEEFINPGETLRTAPKLSPEFCTTDWNKNPEVIHNFIRGLAPYPCARSFFRNNEISVSYKIFKSKPEFADHSFQPGEILSDEKNYIKVACKDGFIEILDLQAEGRKRMNTTEFLRGFRIREFSKIGC